jgi:hypothetical protein
MTVTQSITRDDAIKAEIRRELEIAKAKQGNDWQVQAIENSWGDTHLRRLVRAIRSNWGSEQDLFPATRGLYQPKTAIGL